MQSRESLRKSAQADGGGGSERWHEYESSLEHFRALSWNTLEITLTLSVHMRLPCTPGYHIGTGKKYTFQIFLMHNTKYGKDDKCIKINDNIQQLQECMLK